MASLAKMRMDLPSTSHVHQTISRSSVWRCIRNFMLGHRHLLRQCARPKVWRSFSSTSRADPPAQTEGGGEEKGEGEWSAPKDPTWAVWKKTIGKQFEEPRRPCNWLGGKVVEFVSVW